MQWLIDLVVNLWEKLIPFVVIPHYDRGVRLRLGKFSGKLEPGLHFKIPFVDEILSHMVKTTTMMLMEQAVKTKDGESVIIMATIKYEVEDVVQLLLEVSDPVGAISDLTKGIIRQYVINMDMADCAGDPDLDRKITIKARNEGKKWGIYIHSVTITDLDNTQSIRLYDGH